jgi:hypothetical protein
VSPAPHRAAGPKEPRGPFCGRRLIRACRGRAGRQSGKRMAAALGRAWQPAGRANKGPGLPRAAQASLSQPGARWAVHNRGRRLEDGASLSRKVSRALTPRRWELQGCASASKERPPGQEPGPPEACSFSLGPVGDVYFDRALRRRGLPRRQGRCGRPKARGAKCPDMAPSR